MEYNYFFKICGHGMQPNPAIIITYFEMLSSGQSFSHCPVPLILCTDVEKALLYPIFGKFLLSPSLQNLINEK